METQHKSLSLTKLSTPTLFAIFGIITGILLELVSHWIDSSNPARVLVIQAILLFLPVALLLWPTPRKHFIIGYGLLITLLTLWTSFNLGDTSHNPPWLLSFFFILLTVLVVSLPFAQAWQTSQPHYSYANLFKYAWNNFHIVLLGLLFTGLFSLVSLLAGILFSQIGLDMVDIVMERMALYTTAFALGVSIIQTYDDLLLRLHRLVFALYHIIAYMVAFISLMFALVLPFVWRNFLDSGSAAFTLLFLTVGGIALLNTWVESKSENLPNWANWIFRIQIVLQPLLSALALYALAVRVSQYGLTPTRTLGLLLGGLLLIYALAYLWQLRKGACWSEGLQSVNPPLAMLTVLVAFLTLTPVLDPLRLSTNHQLERLKTGQVSAKTFDFDALGEDFGKPGRTALADIQTWTDHPEYALIQQKRNERKFSALSYRERQTLQAEQLQIYPSDRNIDKAKFMSKANSTVMDYYLSGNCDPQTGTECWLVFQDLDQDDKDEAILLEFKTEASASADKVYYLTGFLLQLDKYNMPTQGHRLQINSLNHQQEESLRSLTEQQAQELKAALKAGKMTGIAPILPDIAIGNFRLRRDGRDLGELNPFLP